MRLNYGVREVEIPDNCRAALGYRAILRKGFIELVHGRADRCMVEVIDWHSLQNWHETTCVGWLYGLSQRISAADPVTYALDEGPFHLRASAQASYRYLYVTVWLDA